MQWTDILIEVIDGAASKCAISSDEATQFTYLKQMLVDVAIVSSFWNVKATQFPSIKQIYIEVAIVSISNVTFYAF